MGYTDQKIVGDIIATVNADDRENIKELFCQRYCRYTEEYHSFYKDVDEAMDNLMREKCEMCPLNKI